LGDNIKEAAKSIRTQQTLEEQQFTINNPTEKTVVGNRQRGEDESSGPVDYHVGDNEPFYDCPTSEEEEKQEDSEIEEFK
jgi:uncharacterized metal-binding protein YceD (DUF177 family)